MSNDRSDRAPGPDHREIYLIIAALVVGIALGPLVLGTIAPVTYDRLFVLDGQGMADLQQQQDKVRNIKQLLNTSGATYTALEEQLRQLDAEKNRFFLDASRRHLNRLGGLMTALVLAVVALMLIEAVTLFPRSALRRLATARYMLLAVWITLAGAQPMLLRGASSLFVIALVSVTIVAAVVPIATHTNK